jgi:hypothetical protein
VRVTLPSAPGHSPTETLVLILVALLVPGVTWVVLALAAKRRDRPAPAS